MGISVGFCKDVSHVGRISLLNQRIFPKKGSPGKCRGFLVFSGVWRKLIHPMPAYD
jgi:hypothetical protein